MQDALVNWIKTEQFPGVLEVIHLDPMFPVGRRAMERKAMRVLRRVVGDDADAGDLLCHVLKLQNFRGDSGGRVVVKRPRKAASLIDDPKPVHQHKGNAMRYDVYAG